MLNYIKMDLQKICYSRILIIATILIILFNGMTILSIKSRLEYASEKATNQNESLGMTLYIKSDEGDIDMGMHIDMEEAVKNGGNLLNCVETLYNGGFLLFFVTLVAIVVICNDFSTGYIKNTITIPRYRWYANVSKLVSAFIVFLFENFIGILMFVVTITFTDYFGDAKIGSMKDMSDIAKYIFVEAVLVLGIVAITIFLANLTKSKVITILISILLVFRMFEGSLFIILKTVFKISDGSRVMKYMIMNRSSSITATDSMSMQLQSIGIGLVWLAVFMVLANMVICKRDI